MSDYRARVFITRLLSPDSPFVGKLTVLSFQVIGASLIDFQPEPVLPVPAHDWCFFYSPRAVQFYFERSMVHYKTPIERQVRARYGVMGEGTEEAALRYLNKVDLRGNGQPKAVADQLAEKAFDRRILFPQARNSRRSVEKHVGDAAWCLPYVVYNNVPLRHFELPPSDVLVFTSPLNVDAYFGRYELQPEQRTVAIGRTTAAALRQRRIKVHGIAKQPTEAALAAAVLKIS